MDVGLWCPPPQGLEMELWCPAPPHWGLDVKIHDCHGGGSLLTNIVIVEYNHLSFRMCIFVPYHISKFLVQWYI